MTQSQQRTYEKKIKKNEVKNGDWSLGILLTNVAHRDGACRENEKKS